MSRTSLTQRLQVLNELYVHTELQYHMLSFTLARETTEEGKSYVKDKMGDLSRQLRWIHQEIDVCEIKLGIHVE